MTPDPITAAQFLSLVGLMAATIEYCEVMRRREVLRVQSRQQEEAARAGLIGLVRVFAADGDAQG